MRSLWLFLAALLVLLTGCTGGTGRVPPKESVSPAPVTSPASTAAPRPTRTPAETPAPAQTASPARTAAPRPTPEPTPTAAPQAGPDREEVLAAYALAREAWGWFHIAPLNCDRTVSREVNGEPYWQVIHPTIRSTAELLGYLKGLFSDEAAAELLPYGGTQYLDLDGELWVRASGWLEEWPEEQVEVQTEEAPAAYTLWVELLPPAEGEAAARLCCRYQQVGERWLFTSFFSPD